MISPSIKNVQFKYYITFNGTIPCMNSYEFCCIGNIVLVEPPKSYKDKKIDKVNILIVTPTFGSFFFYFGFTGVVAVKEKNKKKRPEIFSSS